MSSLFAGEGRARRRARLDISPLIDIVFLLLIFFAVTTTFLEQAGMDLELPESGTAAATDTAPIVVELSSEGAMRLQGEQVTVEDLESRIAALSEAERERITVRADGSVDLNTWVAVIDALRRGGAAGIALPMIPVERGNAER